MRGVEQELGGTVPVRVRKILRGRRREEWHGVHHKRIQPKVGDTGTPFRVNEDTRLRKTAYQSKDFEEG